MADPLVSIILPTYNGSRYIRESIESCLAQEFKDFELIIVNDCSTDNTPAIIEEYANKDPRVRILHNPVNKKLPLSLNAGSDTARGKYHTWTSDDNYYAPEALKVLVDVMEKDPGTGYIYTDYTIIDDEGKTKGVRQFGDINKKFTGFQGSSACFLYKAELYRVNGGYDPSFFLVEDYEFFVKCFLNSTVVYLPRHDLYYYREHGASLSATRSNEVNGMAKQMLEQKMERLEKKLTNFQLALLYRKFAVYKSGKKNKQAARQYLSKLRGISIAQWLITKCYILLRS
jgi:glycosyltransferase involved in cell wall biosynthesis